MINKQPLMLKIFFKSVLSVFNKKYILLDQDCVPSILLALVVEATSLLYRNSKTLKLLRSQNCCPKIIKKTMSMQPMCNGPEIHSLHPPSIDPTACRASKDKGWSETKGTNRDKMKRLSAYQSVRLLIPICNFLGGFKKNNSDYLGDQNTDPVK